MSRRRPGDQAGRRGRRELEADIGGAGRDRQRPGGRPPSRARPPPCPGAPLSRASERDAGHRRRPHDRCRRPGEDGVGDDRDEDRAGARPARAARRGARPTSPATRAMFQPEIATTCERPVAVNAAARSRSTRSRSPTRIPAARPAAGSGSARASASPAARRVRSRSDGRVAGAAEDGERRRSQRPGDAAAPQEVAVAALGRGRRPARRGEPRSPGSTAGIAGRRDGEGQCRVGRRGSTVNRC